MLRDESLHQALLNNSVFGIVMVSIQTSLALLLAVLVNQKMRGMALFRTIYFSPDSHSSGGRCSDMVISLQSRPGTDQ